MLKNENGEGAVTPPPPEQEPTEPEQPELHEAGENVPDVEQGPEPEPEQPAAYDELNLEYDPFQENVAIMGLQGEGKTTLAHFLLSRMPQVPRVIWSPQRPMHLYGQFGDPVYAIKDIYRAAQVYCGEYSARAFDAYCARVMEMYDIVCVWDDIHEYCGKQRIPENFARIINSGRNRGICSIFLSPSPNLVHNVILQSSQHVFCFRMTLETQIEWVRKNYFGPDAWVLLPRRLRRGRPTIGDNYDVLPKHSYLYRKVGDVANTLIVGGTQ